MGPVKQLYSSTSSKTKRLLSKCVQLSGKTLKLNWIFYVLMDWCIQSSRCWVRTIKLLLANKLQNDNIMEGNNYVIEILRVCLFTLSEISSIIIFTDINFYIPRISINNGEKINKRKFNHSFVVSSTPSIIQTISLWNFKLSYIIWVPFHWNSQRMNW